MDDLEGWERASFTNKTAWAHRTVFCSPKRSQHNMAQQLHCSTAATEQARQEGDLVTNRQPWSTIVTQSDWRR